MAVVSSSGSGQGSGQKKSGLKQLSTGQVLFNEGDTADSMYIIQKGQLRLYRPKGKGFVEIAVLRAGEVIGEMSYFDSQSKRRSASASAIMPTDVIEISFSALDKTMTTLNPWFKTLINSLVDRLKKSNEKVKELETNSVGYSSGYKYFQSGDIVKILSLLFLSFRSMGENKEGKWQLSFSKFKNYAVEIFNIQEAKLEEFIQLLKDEKIIEVQVNPDESKSLMTREPETFRIFQVFINTQRTLRDDKKININAKCERFINKVMETLDESQVIDGSVEVSLTKVINHFKEYNIPVTLDDFTGAKNAKFCGEYKMGDNGEIKTIFHLDYVRRMYPVIKFMNAINKVNEAKSQT